MSAQAGVLARKGIPFHRLSDAAWEAMKASGATWNEVAARHPQPKWCDYPDAVSPLGCWSLIGRMVTGKKYCGDCDCKRARVTAP